MRAIDSRAQRCVDCIDHEWFLSEEIYSELGQCILHGKEFLVMHWIVSLSWFQLTRLIADDAFSAFVVCLHERTADGEVARITNHKEWFVMIGNGQDWCLDQTLFDRVEGLMTFISPLSFCVLFKEERQWQ